MGVSDEFDNMKDQAKDKLGSSDEADEKIDSAADKANEMTGGKMSDKVDKASGMAKDATDKLNG